MRWSQASRTIRSYADSATEGPAWIGGGVAVLATALWEAFTSVLASVLGLLFFVDLFLGIAVAVHVGGLGAFDWDRFWRAFVKMAAAILGIALFAAGDLLLTELGVPGTWRPLTAAGLTAMCWGFFMSALVNFGHFFPRVKDQVEKMLNKVRARDGQPMRRAGDRATEPEA